MAVQAQEDNIGKRTVIVFITSDVIANENFDNTAFVNWAKEVQAVMAGLMKRETSNSVVKILANWKKGGNCQFEVGICPANDSLETRVWKALNTLVSPQARFTGFQLLFSFKFNNGCDAPETFSPPIVPADEKMLQLIASQNLSQAKETLRNWALQEVIPVLSHYCVSVDAQFAGVKEVGRVLDKKLFLNGQTDVVTDQNPLYWRGLMEMSRGNLLIPVSKMFMYVANDEFDKAQRYMSILFRFADKESLASHYMLDLQKYFKAFFAKHDSLMKEAIVLHDAGQYDSAISKYNTLLAAYPHSAWARYELYFSTMSKEQAKHPNSDEATATWNRNKSAVYAEDPMYPMGGGANTARDGFILFRHMQVKELFKESRKLKEDLATYAAIALDLEYYPFAAHLYWYLLTVFPEEKVNGHGFLAYYLYSLKKAGIAEPQSYFNTNYSAEFSAIDKERDAAMKNDPMYKSFKEE